MKLYQREGVFKHIFFALLILDVACYAADGPPKGKGTNQKQYSGTQAANSKKAYLIVFFIKFPPGKHL